MKKKLKIGVISCSIMAQVHMQAVMDNPNTELAMLCDLNETLLHEAADKFGVEKTAVDYRVVLNDPEIDAVIIVTPDQTHKEITLAALAAKKHVLCEKPMALKLDECSEMIAAAKAAETKMMVGQICRYTPGFVEAKNSSTAARSANCSLWKPSMHMITQKLICRGVLTRCVMGSLAEAAMRSIWPAGLPATRRRFSPTRTTRCCQTIRPTTAPSPL